MTFDKLMYSSKSLENINSKIQRIIKHFYSQGNIYNSASYIIFEVKNFDVKKICFDNICSKTVQHFNIFLFSYKIKIEYFGKNLYKNITDSNKYIQQINNRREYFKKMDKKSIRLFMIENNLRNRKLCTKMGLINRIMHKEIISILKDSSVMQKT